jgi:hypothetical protein
MKYIITENRLNNIIFKYLDTKFEGVDKKKGNITDVVFVFPDEQYGIVGFEYSGNLYVDYRLVDEIKSLFEMNADNALKVVGRYVEDRYNLEVFDVLLGQSLFGDIVE